MSCPMAPAGKAEQRGGCGAGEMGTCRGLWLGWPSPPQSRGLLLGGPGTLLGDARGCVVTPSQGGLILQGSGLSTGVSHAELLGGPGLRWREVSGASPRRDAVCSRSVWWGSGKRLPPGTARICRVGIV